MYSEQSKNRENDNENPILRSLVQILSQRQCVRKSAKLYEVSSFRFCSIVQRNLQNVEFRDTIIKIMKLCQSFSFADMLGDLDDFETMIKTATAVVVDTLNDASFVETQSTSKITTLKWPRGVSSVTYISETCLI